jgi:hypothetical protein
MQPRTLRLLESIKCLPMQDLATRAVVVAFAQGIDTTALLSPVGNVAVAFIVAGLCVRILAGLFTRRSVAERAVLLIGAARRANATCVGQ